MPLVGWPVRCRRCVNAHFHGGQWAVPGVPKPIYRVTGGLYQVSRCRLGRSNAELLDPGRDRPCCGRSRSIPGVRQPRREKQFPPSSTARLCTPAGVGERTRHVIIQNGLHVSYLINIHSVFLRRYQHLPHPSSRVYLMAETKGARVGKHHDGS